MALSGTYSASKIRVSRKGTQCKSCLSKINKGNEYLSYAWGQRNRKNYCMTCASVLNQYGEPNYDCYAIREKLGIKQRVY